MMCAKTKMRPIQPCMAVLAPTRELAIQIGEVLHNVGEVVKVESAIVYGGMPKYVQKNALKTAHIVVATPGRLQDLMQEGSCDLSKVTLLRPSSPPQAQENTGRIASHLLNCIYTHTHTHTYTASLTSALSCCHTGEVHGVGRGGSHAGPGV
jgi:hypothetical protein